MCAVASGADVNGGVFGHAALHHCCTNGHPDMAAYLAGEGGADFNMRDVVGETPFYHACRDGQLSCAQVLAGVEGCDLTTPHNDGTSPLEIAKRKGRQEVVTWLEPIINSGVTKGGAAVARM